MKFLIMLMIILIIEQIICNCPLCNIKYPEFYSELDKEGRNIIDEILIEQYVFESPTTIILKEILKSLYESQSIEFIKVVTAYDIDIPFINIDKILIFLKKVNGFPDTTTAKFSKCKYDKVDCTNRSNLNYIFLGRLCFDIFIDSVLVTK